MEKSNLISLEQFIEKNKKQNKLIEEDILTNYIQQICKELIELHRNKIILKNLTPKNISINENNKIKIGEVENENSMIGNVNYRAPELEESNNNDNNYDNRVDIYSLGCIIYELFTLKVYEEKEIKDSKINTEKYNIKWQELINVLLIKDYNKRPNIEEAYYKFIKKNEISLILKIDKNDINKQIYYLDNTKTHSHLKDIEISNKELYIYDEGNNFENNKAKNIKKFFIPKKEGIYTVKIKFYNSINDCSYMFYDCSNINYIDLSSFDTDNVINMSYMFKGCRNLENIDLSSFNTDNVENMECMFYYCNKLNKLDLSSFNTKKVKNMSCVFNNCANLESINLSSFNTENVINMDYMFGNCTNIKSIDLSLFNIKNVKDMSYMFCDCINLNNLILPSLIQENYKFGIFTHCDNLKIDKNIQEIIKKDNPYFDSNNSDISKI